MAKDCVKLIYVLPYLVVANLLLLIALSAISASVQVNDYTGLKLSQQSLNAQVFIKRSLLWTKIDISAAMFFSPRYELIKVPC